MTPKSAEQVAILTSATFMLVFGLLTTFATLWVEPESGISGIADFALTSGLLANLAVAIGKWWQPDAS